MLSIVYAIVGEMEALVVVGSLSKGTTVSRLLLKSLWPSGHKHLMEKQLMTGLKEQ